MDIHHPPLAAMARRLRFALRRAYERFIRIRGDPKDICFGLALGIFLGISPLFGFQLILAVLIAALLKWNKIAAAIGTLISNPLTTPFIYPFAYFVGNSVRQRSSRLREKIGKKVASRRKKNRLTGKPRKRDKRL